MKKKRADKDNKKIYAFISCFFTIIGFILAFILWKDDKYIMYYAEHGLILFVGQILIIVLSQFLFFISYILWIFWVVLWIISWMNSFSGQIKKTFLISDLVNKLDI